MIRRDAAGQHEVRARRASGRWSLELAHSDGSRRSPLHEALRVLFVKKWAR